MWKIYFCPPNGCRFMPLQGQYNTRGEAEQHAGFLKRRIQGVIQVMEMIDLPMPDSNESHIEIDLSESVDLLSEMMEQKRYRIRSRNMTHTIYSVISFSKCSYSLRRIDHRWVCSTFSSDGTQAEIDEILEIARGVLCDKQ